MVDCDEQTGGFGGHETTRSNAALGEDLSPFDSQQSRFEDQFYAQRRRLQVSDREGPGHSRATAERLNESQYLVECRSDEATVHTARRAFVRRTECYDSLGGHIARRADADRRRERVGETDQRALIEKRTYVSGVRGLRRTGDAP